ncbi:unnamed protein product [Arabidopsis lyrata]|nr:unnamed protein product [Arabidopsis lyrata]
MIDSSPSLEVLLFLGVFGASLSSHHLRRIPENPNLCLPPPFDSPFVCCSIDYSSFPVVH